MSLPVVVQDDADIEVEEAALWYEEERPGLGLEYIAAVSRVILDIGGNPERFPVWRVPWRRALLRRFPFVVFFMLACGAPPANEPPPSQDPTTPSRICPTTR